jgi:hypothetical protein
MAETLNISDIQLFNLLKSKFGDKEAEQFVALVKNEIEKHVDEKHQIITKDISTLRDELYKNFATKADIAESKADMIKWMFIFVFSSTLLTIVSIFAIVKFFLH